MNIPKIKMFLKIFNSGRFLEYQATEKGLTHDDIEYMLSKCYIVHIQGDEYRVTKKGSEFAFE